MSQHDPPSARYGRDRTCPQCGTRVAQRASVCFFCGVSLERAGHPHRALPWADFALFAVLAGLLALWWLRAPTAPDARRIAEVSGASSELTAQAALITTPSATPRMATRTQTPVPTGTPQPSPTGLPTPMRYKVQPGDTVELIAGMHGASPQDVIQANGLTTDAFIRVGQELIVPVAGAVGGPGPTATPDGGTLVYSVQSGDTIGSIAIRFGSEIDWIFKANGLSPADLLHVGQSLLVPLTPNTPSPTPVPSAQPSPTTVAGPQYRAPTLLTPADSAAIAAAEPALLTWASVGVLGKDEWYVVTLESPGVKTPNAPYWTKSTAWRLPGDYRAGNYAWQVQVLAGRPGSASKPLSAPSSIRHFNLD